ncbi:MAG: hypothetical protein ACK53K_01030 [Burkholderiales bacterium]
MTILAVANQIKKRDVLGLKKVALCHTCLLLQSFEDDDLGLALLDGLPRRGLIDNGFLEIFVILRGEGVVRFPNVFGNVAGIGLIIIGVVSENGK